MKVHLTHNAETTSRFRYTTAEFARLFKVETQTVRKQYAATGSYFGTVPLRLPNRRLLWPSDAIEKLAASQMSGEAA